LLEGRPNVTVVGPVPRNGVIGQLASFDVLLFPSTCEGSPGAVMEALASGLPVVTSPTAGTVVRHEKEGFVHAYDDVDALAAAIDRLASDKQLRREMSWAARQRVESFDVDVYGRGLVEVFGRGRATAAS
jgi:glycosyltransferase involved in cell wall biosynthesis